MLAISRLDPEPLSLTDHGKAAFGLDDKVNAILAAPVPPGWQTSGSTRERYLDISEALVRYGATHWVTDHGEAVDPADGEPYVPFRWVAGAAVLRSFGRIPDLGPKLGAAMTHACQELGQLERAAGFWTPELTLALLCLQDIATPEELSAWRELLSAVEPEALYDMHMTHNWMVYACTGEALRGIAGLKPTKDWRWGEAFFDTHMAPQIDNISDLGMYRDPGDPITYDITTRLKWSTAVALGYDGKWRAVLNELMRRGGYATLLFPSPAGDSPYGGRSDQFLFQEVMLAALCELEARRHKDTNPRLAGAFRRQAHLSTHVTRRWLLDMDPPRSIKNAFPITTKHGFDSYRPYAADIDFMTSLLGLAALFADDEIEETPCPAEIGGYVFEIEPAFHKIFVTCQDTHIEIDTQADPHYNATGLGRFCVAGVPLELGMGMPIAKLAQRWNQPATRMADELHPDRMLAIGPAWRTGQTWTSLASLTSDLTHTTEVLTKTAQQIRLRLTYTHAPSLARVIEMYELTRDTLQIHAEVSVAGRPVDMLRFQVPLLVTDGENETEIEATPGRVCVRHLGACFTVRYDEAMCTTRTDERLGNRHGVYSALMLEPQANACDLSLTLTRER